MKSKKIKNMDVNKLKNELVSSLEELYFSLNEIKSNFERKIEEEMKLLKEGLNNTDDVNLLLKVEKEVKGIKLKIDKGRGKDLLKIEKVLKNLFKLLLEKENK